MKLLKILLEKYREEFDLNIKEGLIKTTPPGKALYILRRKFPDEEKYHMWEFDGGITVVILFLPEERKPSYSIKEYEKELFQLMENLGYFPSWLDSISYGGKFNGNIFRGENEIRFEAKYDTKLERIPDFLYHITPQQNWEKIKKIGLVPKSRSKASYHPERVFLESNPENLEDLAIMFYERTQEPNWVLIEINTKNIPQYLNLYYDPNSHGYYTLNNIPPTALKYIKTIQI